VDRTLLVYGPSGSGKSTSFRNLDMSKTAYINIEKKPLPYRGAGNLALHCKPKTLTEVRQNIKTAVEDDNIETIVVDSISMLADNIVYPELVKTHVNDHGQPDTRGGWLVYRDTIVAMLEYCKGSGKNFIFTALETAVYNKKEMIEKTAPAIQGSLKDKLASHFTFVYYTDVVETEDDIRYVYRTNKSKENKDIECKTPMGLHDEICIDNDIALVFKAMDEYYE